MLARQVVVRTMDGELQTIELGTPGAILAGGIQGQALTKLSEKDGDFGWEDPLSMDQLEQALTVRLDNKVGDIAAVLDAINGEVV